VGKLGSVITGKLVAFDTAPLIYYLEDHPDYMTIVSEMFDAFDRGAATGMTSVLTLLEVLVVPLRKGQLDLASSYAELLMHASGVTVYFIDAAICELAAQLRAKYPWLRTPDALQIATAVEHGAALIVTNDDRWKRVDEIEVLFLKEFASI
jgi:predicted nucleic acid-binding protein